MKYLFLVISNALFWLIFVIDGYGEKVKKVFSSLALIGSRKLAFCIIIFMLMTFGLDLFISKITDDLTIAEKIFWMVSDLESKVDRFKAILLILISILIPFLVIYLILL